MTDREKAIVMAYTGVVMLKGEKLKEFYNYLEKLYKRPVYTHEWLTLDIKDKSLPDFIKLCEENTEEKIKHGHWEVYDEYKQTIDGRTFDGWRECSRCRTMYRRELDSFNYCPNCGAIMDEWE